MRIIKRITFLLSLLAMVIPTMKADETTKLYIHFTTGEKMELAFVDTPTITFNTRNALKIKSKTMGLKTKAFNTVTKITFDDLSGVSDAETACQLIKPEIGNSVAFIGFKPGTQVNVVAINGSICQTAEIDNDVRFELSLDDLAKGVYVISADHEICKLVIE